MLFCLYVFDVCGLFCVSGPSGHGARSASQEVTEAHTVRQFQQRPPVLVVGPRSAISPSPYGVAIGLQATGDLRPRQARLLLEPPQTLREVVRDGMGSSVVANALSRHRAYPPRCTADDSLPCERKRSYPGELNRGRRGPGCLPSHPRIDRDGEQAAKATFGFHFTHYHHLSGVPVRSGSQRRTVWSLPLRRRSRSTLGSPEQPLKSGIPLRRLARGKGENWPSSFQHFMMMFCLFQLAHCALVEIG